MTYTNDEIRQRKAVEMKMLPALLGVVRGQLDEADKRIGDYIQTIIDEGEDTHCVWEILGVSLFMQRVMSPNNRFEAAKVRKVIELFETIKSDTMRGYSSVVATPSQCYLFANIFGLYRWVNTQQVAREGVQLLPSEEVRNGEVWDYRALIDEADIMVPRKYGKTDIAAHIFFVRFFYGEADEELYCLANSLDQAKRLYAYTQNKIRQAGIKDIRYTATETNMLASKRNGNRHPSLRVMSAGGKTKDGLKASVRGADEFGSAAYVKDHSDMKNLVDVIDSSMGPRRSPLRFTTTTAGRVTAGPYIQRVEEMQKGLLDGTLQEGQFVYMMQPDPWIGEEEMLTNPKVWKMVNPHLGITVQADFYEKEIARARTDRDYMEEVFTKLFNVFRTGHTVRWAVTPEVVREKQIHRRMEDIARANTEGTESWLTFVGFDFSVGGDLNAMSYLNYNTETGAMFADMDAWISQRTLETSSIGALYRRWIEQGWLHVCEGEVFDSSLAVQRVMELAEQGVNFHMFGYDPYRADVPVNAIRSWVLDQGADPKKVVFPVRQSFGQTNPAFETFTLLMLSKDIRFEYSDNPLWVWEVGNVAVVEDLHGNSKVVKESPGSDACKVDNVQCLLNAVSLYCMADGAVE